VANVIKIKNSGTASSSPSANSLATGELAINYRDGKLFYKDNLGAVKFFSADTVQDTQNDLEILSWMGI